jgi:uncharacterized membrane protein YeiB
MPAPGTITPITHTSLSTGRFLSFDIIRGFAVLTIVMIHRVHYTWTGMTDRVALHRAMEAGGLQFVVIVLTIILFTTGGIFYVVSGSVNAYASCRAIISKHQDPGFIFRRNIKTGLFLLLLNIVHRVLFGNGFDFTAAGGEPEYVAGLITGWLKYGEPVPFRWSLVTEPGTLSIICIILLVNTGIMAMVYRRRGLGDSRSLARMFLFFGIGILLVYPFLKLGLTPLYEQAYASGRYLLAWLFGNLCLEYSISPHLAFGIFGAYVGILLASGAERKHISIQVSIIALVLIGAGALIAIVFGADTSLGDRLNRAGISIFGLGVFLFIEVIALRLWDWRRRNATEPSQQSWFVERLRLFGRYSLTVFVFEGLLAELIALPLGLAIGSGWTGNLWAVLGFTVLPTAAWMLLLSWWSRARFDGPLEWARRYWKYGADQSLAGAPEDRIPVSPE